jgi:hypothetical protein
LVLEIVRRKIEQRVGQDGFSQGPTKYHPKGGTSSNEIHHGQILVDIQDFEYYLVCENMKITMLGNFVDHILPYVVIKA